MAGEAAGWAVPLELVIAPYNDNDGLCVFCAHGCADDEATCRACAWLWEGEH